MDTQAALKAEMSVLGGEKIRDRWTIPPDWFARRYGVAPPSVYRQIVKAFDESTADVYYLKAASKDDESRLWRGLAEDLTANQKLVRKGQSLIWIISDSPTRQDKIAAFLKPDTEAPRPKEDFAFLRSEIPRDVPGLSYDHTVFVQQILPLEQRTGGISVRALYQASFVTPGQSFRKQLAQVDFWVVRDRARLEDLTRFFESHRDSEQAVYTGKGVVAVLTAHNPVGRDILLERLSKLGYRRVSPPDPTPTATPTAKTESGSASDKE